MPWIRKILYLTIILIAVTSLAYIFAGQFFPDYQKIKSTGRGSAPPKIVITQGELQGVWTKSDEIAFFAGIPYAAPPIGDLRFVPPQKHKGWSGIRPATRFGTQCLQQSGTNDIGLTLVKGLGFGLLKETFLVRALKTAPPEAQSEDCLFINVRTNNIKGEAKQPVMVWIHGGGHQSGHGSMFLYQSNNLVEHDVVHVTFNYRLGIMGYFSHPALSADSTDGVSGNYGLLDQIAALEWVRANIEQFGGDPNNVTIYGESAGGQSVSELMTAPLAKGLFHRAILQSGVYTHQADWINYSSPNRKSLQEWGELFIKRSKLIPGEVTAKRLRDLDAKILLQAERDIDLGIIDWTLPAADGVVLPKTVAQALVDGDLTQVPILVGFNKDEGSLFTGFSTQSRLYQRTKNFPQTAEEAAAFLRSRFGKNYDAIEKAYGQINENSWAKIEENLFTDLYFGYPSKFLAREMSNRKVPVYAYYFSRDAIGKNQTLGAFHTAEIPFVMDNHSLIPTNADDRVLTDNMVSYWTNFAKNGDPNGKGLLQWRKYNPTEDNWLNLDHEINLIYDLRKEKFEALKGYVDQRIARSRKKRLTRN